MQLSWEQVVLLCLSILASGTESENATRHRGWSLLENRKCGSSNAVRIIGGKNASLGAYPWIARVGYSVTDDPSEPLTYRCGGSLIGEYYVVTAAHCVTNLPARFKVSGVRLGEHNTATDPDCEAGYCGEPVQDIAVESVRVHEKYNEPANLCSAFDTIDRCFPIDPELVMPICLPRGELLEKSFVGEKADVAGWGIYDINDPQPSTVLQTLKVPIVATSWCRQAFRRHAELDDRQMCVGGVVGEDACAGDSGGPLMKVEVAGDGPPSYFLVGLVSFGAKHCASTATPAVYTRLSQYVPWILDNLDQ